MASVNRAIIIGRLGRDPEVRHTQSGQVVASFSVATDESYKDKQGNKVEAVEWHNVTAFGKTAEFVSTYLSKGRLVYVEGKLETRKWTDKDGAEKYTTEVKADRVLGLDSRQADAHGASAPAQGQEYGGREEYNSMGDSPF